jgi:16S rRNA (uracil1498-N3)-methyltransferase
MSERFYVSCPLRHGTIVLQGPEAHHLAVVCRLRAGDAVGLFNGDGRQYRAVVAEAGKKAVTLEIEADETPVRELPFRLEIAVPLPKGDRAQFLVEKLTELGATRLVPLRTDRSIVFAGEGRQEKLQRWVIEASKQCGRNVLMEIAPLLSWSDYIGRADLPARRLLAHPGGDPVAEAHRGEGDVVVAVGPEGGFTDAEVASARAVGWRTVGLGPRILRVETAAIAVASLLTL